MSLSSLGGLPTLFIVAGLRRIFHLAPVAPWPALSEEYFRSPEPLRLAGERRRFPDHHVCAAGTKPDICGALGCDNEAVV